MPARSEVWIEPVAELLRHPGARRVVHRSLPGEGLATSVAAVPPGGVLEADLVLESLSDGVVVSGTVQVPWQAECRRCLREIEGSTQVELREVFQTHAVEGETWPLDGDRIDLAPVLREAALLDLPLAPLCEEACLGPEPDRFPATVEADEPAPTEAEAEEGPPHDPRWAALDELHLEERPPG